MICVYVAVGQKSSTVKRVIDAVHRDGAPERCIFVIASASSAPGLQWIAPFAGFTFAEYFRDRGDGRFRVEHTAESDPREAIFRLAVDRGWTLTTLAAEKASLEDVFVRLTTREESGAEPPTEPAAPVEEEV